MKKQINYRISGIITAALIGLMGCSGEFPEPTDTELGELKERAVDNQVFVEGGSFLLGDVGHPDSGRPWTTLIDNNSPAVEVTLNNYSISKYEVTWGDFIHYLRDVGRAKKYVVDKDYYLPNTNPIDVDDDPLSPHYYRKPARSPNYEEAEGYCEWLGELTGLPFALPTEAQWEYAARSRGENVPYATDDGTKDNDTYLQRPREYIDPSIPPSGNMLSHSSNVLERRPVGSYPPNPLGLHDMSGNVAEWTRDWYQADFYQHAPRKNPSGPEAPPDPDNPEKVVRDWAGHGSNVGGGGRVFAREGRGLDNSRQGFRCVVNHQEPLN